MCVRAGEERAHPRGQRLGALDGAEVIVVHGNNRAAHVEGVCKRPRPIHGEAEVRVCQGERVFGKYTLDDFVVFQVLDPVLSTEDHVRAELVHEFTQERWHQSIVAVFDGWAHAHGAKRCGVYLVTRRKCFALDGVSMRLGI